MIKEIGKWTMVCTSNTYLDTNCVKYIAKQGSLSRGHNYWVEYWLGTVPPGLSTVTIKCSKCGFKSPHLKLTSSGQPICPGSIIVHAKILYPNVFIPEYIAVCSREQLNYFFEQVH